MGDDAEALDRNVGVEMERAATMGGPLILPILPS
jgi:hypothetical protein